VRRGKEAQAIELASQSDRQKVMDRRVIDRQVEDRQVEDRQVEDRQVEDRQVEDRQTGRNKADERWYPSRPCSDLNTDL
jgi:hypothetical protein